ncbi:MAG TPA: ATP-binding protein [Dongiaceae bacterium]|nr:ATP-binding protein [Dongiaceae bacterium]
MLLASANRLKTSGTRLVFAFSTFVLILLWLSLASFSWHEWRGVRFEAEHDLAATETALQGHLGQTYSAARNLLALIDEWLATRSSTGSQETLQDLAQLITQLQHYDERPISVRLINTADTIIRSLPERDEALSTFVGDRAYVLALKDEPPGAFFISPPVVSRIDGRTVLPIVLRARANDFGVKYVSAAIQEDYVAKAFTGLLAAATVTVGIAKVDGTVLFVLPENSDLKQRMLDNLGSILLPDASPNADTREVALGDGSAALVVSAKLTPEPFFVFAAIDKAVLWQRWLHLIVLPALFVVMSSAAIVAFAHWLLKLLRNSVAESAKLAAALIDAQAASRSKHDFLANMSHELRTPLNAIIGFSELMTTESFGPLTNPAYKGYAEDIGNAGRHLLSIIGEILDTAKMDAGKIEIGTTAIQFNDILQDCDRMLATRIAAKGLTVCREVSSDLPALCMDPNHLKRILLNLIGNAVKFTAQDGRVDIRAAINGEGAFALTIADTGIGIPPRRLNKLFKPFSQVEEGQVRNHDGIGLGLVNTRLIVEAYGGRVWLESEYGRGTQAYVILPADRFQPAQN